MTSNARGLPRAEVAARVLDRLRRYTGGETKAELVAAVARTSAPTMQRVLKELEADGIVARGRDDNRWRLVDREFRLSLEAPDADDLQAVLIAEAVLGSLADDELRSRLRSLAEQIDERIRSRDSAGALPRAASVDVTLTSATRFDPVALARLLKAVRRETVLIEYSSPWDGERRRRVCEPWGLRIHDGAWYLRAYDRERNEPRTVRLAQVSKVSPIPAAGPPKHRVPPRDEIWGSGDPAFGIDNDRPDVARIVVAPPVSRWLEPMLWSPTQEDRWLPGEKLERTVAYRSCREFARVVRSVADAVISVEPLELREAVFGTGAERLKRWASPP